MRIKFTTILSVCLLIAAANSCDKPAYTDPDQGKEKQKEQGKEPEQQEPSAEPLSRDFLSAVQTVSAMGAGWNLGNTLDANSGDTTNMWIEHWGPSGVKDYEKAWGQVPPTRELFRMMHDAGFRAIRVPVTWYPHLGTQFHTEVIDDKPTWMPSLHPLGYTVDAAWMREVKRVVDAVLEADMYCIVNVHHDTGTGSTHWVVADMDSYRLNCERFKGLWQQIAETFKDYDGRLLFEAYNEMTDAVDSWCFASYNTPARYDARIAESAYSAVNSYAQDFVDVVRATGGNNSERNLIVSTYAAASGDGTWDSHLNEPLTRMELPNDSAEDHLLLEVHYYPEFTNITEGKNGVDRFLSNLQTNLGGKGAPIVIGEWGVGGNSKVNYNDKRSDFLKFAEYFVEQAKSYGMATFYWMGISDGKDREVPMFTQPDLKDAIINGIGY